MGHGTVKRVYSGLDKTVKNTFGSCDGGKGRPVITTPLPFESAKSKPSLTYYKNIKILMKIMMY